MAPDPFTLIWLVLLCVAALVFAAVGWGLYIVERWRSEGLLRELAGRVEEKRGRGEQRNRPESLR